MKEFIALLSQFGNLDQHQIELIAGKSTDLELRKGDYFWETGKTSKYVGFVTNGILRVYYDNDKGDEISHYFVEENHWLSDWDNPGKSSMPIANLQDITNCSFIAFLRKDWNELLQSVILFPPTCHNLTLRSLAFQGCFKKDLFSHSMMALGFG